MEVTRTQRICEGWKPWRPDLRIVGSGIERHRTSTYVKLLLLIVYIVANVAIVALGVQHHGAKWPNKPLVASLRSSWASLNFSMGPKFAAIASLPHWLSLPLDRCDRMRRFRLMPGSVEGGWPASLTRRSLHHRTSFRLSHRTTPLDPLHLGCRCCKICNPK